MKDKDVLRLISELQGLNKDDVDFDENQINALKNTIWVYQKQKKLYNIFLLSLFIVQIFIDLHILAEIITFLEFLKPFEFLSNNHILFAGILLIPIKLIFRDVFSFGGIYYRILNGTQKNAIIIQIKFIFSIFIISYSLLQFILFNISIIAWEIGNLFPLIAFLFVFLYDYFNKEIFGEEWLKKMKESRNIQFKKQLWLILSIGLITTLFSASKIFDIDLGITPYLLSPFALIVGVLLKLPSNSEIIIEKEDKIISMIEGYEIISEKKDLDLIIYILIYNFLFNLNLSLFLSLFVFSWVSWFFLKAIFLKFGIISSYWNRTIIDYMSYKINYLKEYNDFIKHNKIKLITIFNKEYLDYFFKSIRPSFIFN